MRTRTDNNTREIDAALRRVGAVVIPLSDVGHGCPDRLCGFRGANILLEYKQAGKRDDLTPAQKIFHQVWPGQKAIVTTVDEALEAIGALNGRH